MPRGTKLTPDRIARTAESVANGNTLRVAGGAGGLSERSVARYLQRGQAADHALQTRLDNEWTADQRASLDDLDPADADALLLDLVDETERPYWRFWQALTHARDVAEERLVDVVVQSATGYDEVTIETREVLTKDGEIVTLTSTSTKTIKDWRAALAWLERARPQEWGRYNRTELSGPDGGPIEIAGMEDARARGLALVAQLERRALEPGPSVEGDQVEEAG